MISANFSLRKSLADKMFLQNILSCKLSELVDIIKGKQLNADTLSETGDSSRACLRMEDGMTGYIRF